MKILFCFLFFAVLLSPVLQARESMIIDGGLSGSKFRSHINLETQEGEVSFEAQLNSQHKFTVTDDSRGFTNFKYTYRTFFNAQTVLDSSIGYYYSDEFYDIGYASLQLSYLLSRNFALSVAYTDSLSVIGDSPLDQHQGRVSAIWSPVQDLKLMYQYSYNHFKNVPDEMQGMNKNECYVSYTFSNGSEPYLYSTLDDIMKETSLHLGYQHNF